MSHSEFLISLAQNDYMIDQHMLPDGERLYRIADYILKLQETNEFLENLLLERGETD